MMAHWLCMKIQLGAKLLQKKTVKVKEHLTVGDLVAEELEESEYMVTGIHATPSENCGGGRNACQPVEDLWLELLTVQVRLEEKKDDNTSQKSALDVLMNMNRSYNFYPPEK